MKDRFDVVLGDAQVTGNHMDNDEYRLRIKLHGTRVSLTLMPPWDLMGDSPWQEEHFHKGLTEHYVVLVGWAVFIYADKDRTQIECKLIQAGSRPSTISFGPGEPHRVLLGPGTIISTRVEGEKVPNPSRKQEDWWPSSVTASFPFNIVSTLRVEGLLDA